MDCYGLVVDIAKQFELPEPIPQPTGQRRVRAEMAGDSKLNTRVF
jgi:hypothetical protein